MFKFSVKNKVIFGLVLLVVVLIGVIIVGGNMFLYHERSVATSNAILNSFEKQGKLQVLKMYFDQVHKEEVVRDLFGVDWLAPDSKTLVTFTSVASYCVDLTKVKAVDVKIEKDFVDVVLPLPEFCEDPYIVPDSFDVYDQNLIAILLDPQLEIVAQKKAIKLARKKAIDSGIAELAKKQADVILGNLLSVVAEKPVHISFKTV